MAAAGTQSKYDACYGSARRVIANHAMDRRPDLAGVTFFAISYYYDIAVDCGLIGRRHAHFLYCHNSIALLLVDYCVNRNIIDNSGVVEVMRWGRLRWFGRVERKEVGDWVSACRNLEVAGSRGGGRPRMTWRARCLDGDMKDMGLRPGMAMDQEKWRCGIMGRTSDPHKRGNKGR